MWHTGPRLLENELQFVDDDDDYVKAISKNDPCLGREKS